MVAPNFSARYTAAMAECGGRCPIEAGVIGRLADHECRTAGCRSTARRSVGAGRRGRGRARVAAASRGGGAGTPRSVNDSTDMR